MMKNKIKLIGMVFIFTYFLYDTLVDNIDFWVNPYGLEDTITFSARLILLIPIVYYIVRFFMNIKGLQPTDKN